MLLSLFSFYGSEKRGFSLGSASKTPLPEQFPGSGNQQSCVTRGFSTCQTHGHATDGAGWQLASQEISTEQKPQG